MNMIQVQYMCIYVYKKDIKPIIYMLMNVNFQSTGSGRMCFFASEVALQRLPQHGFQLLDGLLALMLHLFTLI